MGFALTVLVLTWEGLLLARTTSATSSILLQSPNTNANMDDRSNDITTRLQVSCKTEDYAL